jgi:hypothetical protein
MDSLRFVRDWSSEKGAELVEFALTFPLMLLVVLGIIDFGLLLQRYEVLTNAAREGARVAVLGYSTANIQTRVDQYLLGTGLDTGVVTTVGAATFPPIGGGNCITVIPVTVTYTHNYMFVGGIASFFGSTLGSKTLNATANMRRELAAIPCPGT